MSGERSAMLIYFYATSAETIVRLLANFVSFKRCLFRWYCGRVITAERGSRATTTVPGTNLQFHGKRRPV